MTAISEQTRARLAVPRWCYGEPNHWALGQGCPCCGNMGGTNGSRHLPCEPAACLLCGSLQCNSHSGRCIVCHYGWLPGWSRDWSGGSTCGYAGCGEPAVAVVPGKKRACTAHARRKVGAEVDARIAHRDSGRPWERFRLTGPLVPW